MNEIIRDDNNCTNIKILYFREMLTYHKIDNKNDSTISMIMMTFTFGFEIQLKFSDVLQNWFIFFSYCSFNKQDDFFLKNIIVL